MTGILGWRILSGPYDLSGKAPDIMRYLVEDCFIHPTRWETEARTMPGLVLAEQEAADWLPSIRIRKTGGTVLEALEELGETYDVAFGVRFDPRVPQMVFWTRPGVDRSIHQSTYKPIFYSTELDDVLSSGYTYNSGNYRNVALVAGEGEGNDRKMVTVFEDIPEPAEGVGIVGQAVVGKSVTG